MAEPAVVIVGAGPAGTRAAEAVVRGGICPVMVDESPQSGGQIYRRQPSQFTRSAKTLYGFEAGKASQLHAKFDSLKKQIDYRPATLAWNIYENVLYTERDGVTDQIPFDAAIIAPGATDLVLPFPGWSKAGVFTLGGAQVSLKYQACSVGERTAFVGTGPLLYLVAYQYAKAGANVVAVVDTTPFSTKVGASWGMLSGTTTFAKGLFYMASLWSKGIPIFHGATPLAVEGGENVEGLSFRDNSGATHKIDTDAIAMGFGLRPETQIADLAHCEFSFDTHCRQWLPIVDEDGRTDVKGLYLAGDGQRIAGADAAELSGELAAYAALEDLGRTTPNGRTAALRRRLRKLARFRRALDKAFPIPVELATQAADETLICRCEATSAGEIRHAANEMGALEVNKAKAFTRIGMGRCQGRYCGYAGAALVANTLGLPIEKASRLRGQAPVKPLAIADDA
jgi:NADPH-dependent 2,4-dienoyl-CoA reductase/sulfur reductase-like enzyme